MKIKPLKISWVSFKVLMYSTLIALAVAVFFLAKGGLGLGFITPMAAEALSPADPNFSVEIGKAELSFIKAPFPIGLKVYDVKLVNQDKRPVAAISEMTVSLSLRALLKGDILPRSIFLHHPFINVYIAANGKVGIGFDAQNNMTAVDEVAADIGAGGDVDGAGVPDPQAMNMADLVTFIYDDLHSMNILDGQMTIFDEAHNTKWVFPDVDVDLIKHNEDLKAKGNLRLTQRGKNEVPISVDAIFDRSENKLLLDAKVEDLYLPVGVKNILLAGAEVTMPLSAVIKCELSTAPLVGDDTLAQRFKKIDFVFEGGKGDLIFPKAMQASYDIKSLKIEGYSNNAFEDTQITSLVAESEKGAYVFGSAIIEGVDTVLRDNDLSALHIDFKAKGTNIEMANLKDYWPAVIGPATYEWVFANISEGKATSAQFTLGFQGTSEGVVDIVKSDGVVNLEGVTVRYLDTMPVVKNAAGSVYITKDDVKIKITKGESLGLSLYDTDLYFYDIWEPQEQAKMTINVKGSLYDALVLLNTKPLGFLDDLGVSVKGIKGSADTVLNLDFPLRKDLTVDKVKVSATAKIVGAELPLVADYPLQEADVVLNLNNAQMSLTGKGKIKDVLADIAWKEVFSGRGAGSEYKVSAALSDEDRARLGLDFYPMTKNELKGAVLLSLVAKVDKKGNKNVGLEAGLQKAEIYEPLLGVVKPLGVKASFTAAAKVNPKDELSVPSFHLRADNGIDISGSADFALNNKLAKITIDDFKTDKTDTKVTIDFADDKMINVGVFGKSFDFSYFFKSAGETDGAGADAGAGESKNDEGESAGLGLKIRAVVDRLWLSENGYVYAASMDTVMQNGEMEKIAFAARTETGADAKINFGKAGEVYKLYAFSEDGGSLLESFGYSDNIKGGDLKIVGTSTGKGLLSGKILMRDFKVVKAPLLAKVLSVASLTGILDVLQGEGLSFDIAEIPFEYKKSGVYIKDAHTSGLSLGLTAEGTIKKKVWNMEGSIIPAYAVNSLLGKIPLIGALFSGGEKGGGLIGFKYYIDGPLTNPEVRVNPLSALAPGVVRKVFSDNDMNEDEEENAEASKEGTDEAGK